MRATQARVAVLAVAGLLALFAAVTVPAAAPQARGSATREVVREASDPAAGLAEHVAATEQWDAVVRWHAVVAWNAELARQAEAARQAELAARLARERADRSARTTAAAGGVWAALRQCENGGSYTSKPGDYYRGAYQFLRATWESLGYSGDPAAAPPAVQDEAARRLQARSGWGQWPRCARRLGLL